MTERPRGTGLGNFDGQADSSEPPREDLQEYLVECAKTDAPETGLGKRVLAGLAYRTRLENMASPPARGIVRLRNAGGPAVALGLIAVVALALRYRTPTPGPEVTAELGAGSASSARASQKPLVDPCLHRLRAAGTEPLIDDFEDGDDAILLLEQRKALWRWTRDTDAPGTAPALLPLPRPEPRSGSRLGLHVKGGVLKDWGAAIELTFQPGCYDASAYAGIAFAARGPGRVYVSPRETRVITAELGGTCREDCFNGHVKKLDLDDRWRDYQVRWNEVEQHGYGRPPLDPSRLHDLAFLVRSEDTPYELWLDDVRFLQR
jgi:hypothetical protein